MKNAFSIFKGIIILLLVLIFITPTCADNQLIKKEKFIIIVGNKMNPPYSFLDEHGNPTGFNVELVHEIMKKINKPYVLKLMSWSACFDSLKMRKADLIIGIKYNNKLAMQFSFGPILSYNYEYAIYKKDKKPIMAIEDLNNKNVIIENNSNTEGIILDNNIKTAKTIRVKDVETGLLLLSQSKYDAALFSRNTAQYIINKYGIKTLTISDLGLATLEDCIAGNDEKLITETDNAMYKLKKEGIYDRIYNKWLVDKRSQISHTIYMGFTVLIFVLIILSSFNYLLRKKIIKAKDLLYQNDERLKLALRTGGIKVWDYDIEKRKFYDIQGDFFRNKGIDLEEILKRIHPYDQNKLKRTLYNISQNRMVQKPLFIRLDYDENQQYKHLEIEFSPIRDSTGRIIKLIGIRKDITYLIKIQQKLKREKEKAVQSDKLKSQFLANMSHEIRTPLNAILGFSSLLQETANPNERSEFIKIIRTNSDYLLTLINDILDLSKIESGIIDLNPQTFDLTSIFNELYHFFKQKRNHPNIDFICECPYSICNIYLDKNKFMQILSNIVTNAIKYTQSGYIKMGYKQKKNGILIYVEDTGIGIPQKDIDKIFNRFEKLGSFVQGMGIGLSICKSLIEKLNGEIIVKSEIGRGTTFLVYIPCTVDIPKTENNISYDDSHRTMI